MADEKKHFDVAHPGTTSPQHTSRPIIVGRTNEVEDPMVKRDTEQPVGEPEKKRSTLSHASLGLSAPLSGEDNKESETKNLDATPADSSVQDEELKTSTKPENAKPSQQGALVPDKADELIQSRAYELPISHAKSKTVLLPLFVLLMIAIVGAGVYLALLASGRL